MQQRQLIDGRVDLQVSRLCLGTMNFGYRTDEPTSFAILDRFAEAGGNFLDTANNYGQWHGDAGESERVIGRWRRSRGVTDELVVATKVVARRTQRAEKFPPAGCDPRAICLAALAARARTSKTKPAGGGFVDPQPGFPAFGRGEADAML